MSQDDGFPEYPEEPQEYKIQIPPIVSIPGTKHAYEDRALAFEVPEYGLNIQIIADGLSNHLGRNSDLLGSEILITKFEKIFTEKLQTEGYAKLFEVIYHVLLEINTEINRKLAKATTINITIIDTNQANGKEGRPVLHVITRGDSRVVLASPYIDTDGVKKYELKQVNPEHNVDLYKIKDILRQYGKEVNENMIIRWQWLMNADKKNGRKRCEKEINEYIESDDSTLQLMLGNFVNASVIPLVAPLGSNLYKDFEPFMTSIPLPIGAVVLSFTDGFIVPPSLIEKYLVQFHYDLERFSKEIWGILTEKLKAGTLYDDATLAIMGIGI